MQCMSMRLMDILPQLAIYWYKVGSLNRAVYARRLLALSIVRTFLRNRALSVIILV